MDLVGFSLMTSIFPILFMAVFIIVIGTIIVTLVRGVSQWHQNNQSPVLTVEAEIVAKRADVSRHTHMDANNTGMHHTTTSTTYYATFQVESGDRMELHIPRDEYGMLVEGDWGRLTFQGARYLSFERRR